MRKLVPVVAASVAVAVVAVAGATTTLDPKKLVLQKSDVGGLKLAYAAAHPQSSADIQPPASSRTWIVAYARLSAPTLVVVSSAYVFSSSSAAHTGFRTISASFAKKGAALYGPSFTAERAAGLGAEQRAWAAACGGSTCPKGSSQAIVLVRTGRAVWGVDVARAGGKSTALGTAVAYARKQKARVGSG